MSPAPAQRIGGTPGRADVPDQSVGDLVVNLSETASRLLRHEVALAKTETRMKLRATVRSIRTLTVAGWLALAALIMFSQASTRGLGQYVDLGWAYLIVGALWTLTAAILYSKGRTALDGVNQVPERTMDTLNEIPTTGR